MRVHHPTLNRFFFVKCLILVLVLFHSTFVFSQDALDALINSHRIPEGKLSIILEETESNNRLIEINPKKSRSPGSVTKIFTAFSAIDILGKDFQWKTEAYIKRKEKNKNKIDHLLIRGGGDPTFSVQVDTTNITGNRTIKFPDSDATLLSTDNVTLEDVNFGAGIGAQNLTGQTRQQQFFYAGF